MNKIESLSALEEAVSKKSRRERTETAILGSIALVGFLVAVTLAPNAVQVLQHVVPDVRPLSKKQSVKRAIGNLIKKGYIHKINNKYKLTKEGEKRLETLLISSQVRSQKVPKTQKWDKKWRIVIFDIKESHRSKRDRLRLLLVETGFVKLQDSVWVYPHRCDEVIALLKFHLTLGWGLVYIIADAIEGDTWLRKHFKLPNE